MKKMKYLTAAVVVLLLLGAVGYALSPGDSLVTLKYIAGKFVPETVRKGGEAADSKLEEAYSEGKEQLDTVQKGLYTKVNGGESDLLYSAAFRPSEWRDGEIIELSSGSGVLMQEGVATVRHNGVFIDVGEGIEVASGSQLLHGHRYLSGEETTAEIEVLSGAAVLGVQGEYRRRGGIEDPTPFYDVSRLDWYCEQVRFAYNKDLFAGTGKHTFDPALVMDRAMVVTVFYKMAGKPQNELEAASGVSFLDVPEDQWYAPYVKWAKNNGVASGTGGGMFSPEDKINREQFAQLFYNFRINYLKQSEPERADLTEFSDAESVSGWAKDAVSWAVYSGLLGSVRKDTKVLDPQGLTDRAATATMLWLFDQKMK